MTAACDFLIGLCCASVALALLYLGRRFKTLPFRSGSLPFGSFLALTAVSHISSALGIVDKNSWVQRSLLALTGVCAAGTVFLLRDLVRRICVLADRDSAAERREAELSKAVEDLSLAYSRAQELSDLRTQLFSNVSRELRTPLTLILGPIQHLRESASSSEQRDALIVVERNAQLLLGHVTDLLELSRVDELPQRKRQLESLLESLGQALEQAELASRFKTSLLRLVSHELRTPLGALQLQLERLSGEHRGPLNDPQQQLILRMRRSLARLTDTIQSLLEYARIESGRLELVVEPFDAKELARSVIDDFASQAEAKGLRLRLLGAEGSVGFQTDSRLLRLVLVNLVSNALKFTARGEVTLSIECDAERCRLEVADSGPGIEPNQRASVFEPFFQGESANQTHSSQGAGLGLSLVREMLLALGGSIELDSVIGVGSTFRITLPRAELPVAHMEQSRDTA
jgi:signal transduction histidine kinase